MMKHFLSTLLLLLLTSAIAVRSAPSSTTTKKYLRRTEEADGPPKISNDDPDKIDFGFTIQSSKSADVQGVAVALKYFGERLFEAHENYSYRFKKFEVEPTSSTEVAVSRGGGFWRHLAEQPHSNSFVATLTLDKSTSLNGAGVDEEVVKQLFLDAINEAGVLDGLLGEWIAVETDSVPVVPPDVTTTSTGSEGGNSPSTFPEMTNGVTNGVANGATNGATNGVANGVANGVTNGVANPSISSGTETVVAKAPTTNSEGGTNNGATAGIVLGVVGLCLLTLLVAVFTQRRNKRGGNRTTTTATEDHIGDVHVEEDVVENRKSTVTVGMWAAGLLPSKETGAFPTAAPKPAVEVTPNKIDKVIADMHLDSDDSSFVSAESGADNTSCYSGYSGMTGISDLNYQPKNNNETDESKQQQNTLEKVEEMKPSISFLDQSKGSLIREASLSSGEAHSSQGMKKDESFDSDPSGSKGSGGTSQSMRKEESFESDYREKSGFAQLNFKKDMLKTDVGEDDKARTLSAQQNTEMLQQQRQLDKVRAATVKAKKRMKSISPPSRKDGSRSVSPPAKKVVEEEPDESRDHLLPGAEKSDDSSIDSNGMQIV